MHILIPVFFNSPMGGLHENVLSTSLFCKKNNCEVTVLCKPGVFQEKLHNLGINVITTTFTDEDLTTTLEKVIKLNKKDKIDVVHTHPFYSRVYAQHISRILGVPLCITFHGKHTNKIETYLDEIDLIFTVSEGIKDFLIEHLTMKQAENFKQKIFVIPNGVNTEIFNNHVNDSSISNKNSDPITISLVSRLDQDKQFIIDIFYKALAFTVNDYPNKVIWNIVGEGTQKTEIMLKAAEIAQGKNIVNFVGWKENAELATEYQKSDILLAPGRCALEGMSCGKPVIALGSKGYIGLINEKNWLNGVYSNFGGIGNKIEGYQEGSIENDLKQVLDNQEKREKLGELSLTLIDQFYNENSINEKLLGFYKMLHMGNTKQSLLANEPLEMYLLKTTFLNINITALNNNEYTITLNCSDYTGLQFAYYIYKDNSIYEKKAYSNSNILTYTFPEKGKYRLKCYLKKNSTVISFNSKYIYVD